MSPIRSGSWSVPWSQRADVQALSSVAVWDGVIGQEQAVERLRRAVERPSHAYLLAGPRGSGVLEAARCFAAALVCPDGGCGTCNSCRRARSARHPDVIEVEPAGTFVVVDQVEEMMKE